MMLLAFVLLTQTPPAQHFTPVDRPGADPLFATSMRSICPSSHPTDAKLLVADERQAATAADHSTASDRWTELGCARALLSAAGVLSHGGVLMLPGASWQEGAVDAFMQALSLRADDRRAADGLSLLALNESDPSGLARQAAVLDRAAAGGAVDPATLRGCAELELRAGQPDRARRCADRALAAGFDSTEHLLILARLAFRAADTAGGASDFLRAVSAAHDTLSRATITWHLQWLMSPDEGAVWTGLPDSARAGWVRDRFASRDVRDGQPAGSRMAEQFRRLEHADSNFRLKVPAALRTASRTGVSAGGAIDEGEFRDYQRWQSDFDDRGVVWMRFGKPDKVGFADSTGQSPAVEVWYYNIDGTPLLVTFSYEPFSGSVAPSRLITGHIGDVYCGLDARRCLLSMKRKINPEDRLHVREQDREYVSAATTSDDNSVRTDKTIDIHSRLHRLWDPVTGAPIGLLTYAIKVSDLAVQQDHGQRTARIEFDFRRWDAVHDQRQDTTFARRQVLPPGPPVRQLTGFLVTASAPTVTAWSLVVSQDSVRRGRAWDVSSGPLDRGTLALSDVVLGQRGQGLVWSSHNVDILVTPLNAVDRHLPIALYYQIRSDAPRNGLRTVVGLYRVKDGVAADSAALQVGFAQAIQAGINEVAPTLDVSRLDKGAYLLGVRVTDANGVVISRRAVQLNLN